MTDDMKESKWSKLPYEERERRLRESRKQMDDAFVYGTMAICIIMIIPVIYAVVVAIQDWIG